MSRRRRQIKREKRVDARFGDLIVGKFINCMMWSGKKTIAESIFYRALDRIEERFKEKGIDCSIVKYRPIVDKVYVGTNYDREFHIKIKGSEFNKVNEFLDLQISQNISQIGSDYYLHSFTDEELLEIIEKPDEWNNQDLVISKKILQDRGFIISEVDITEKKLKRIKELEKPDKEGRLFIIIGYVFALLFGFFGIGFALLIINSKKTLPDGRKVFVYDRKTRGHGKNILIISLIMAALVFIRIFTNFS